MPKTIVKWTAGDVVRKLREAREQTQEALADAADVSKSTVIRFEKDAVTPDELSVRKILSQFDVTLAEFYGYLDLLSLLDEIATLDEAQRATLKKMIADWQAERTAAQSGGGSAGSQGEGREQFPADRKLPASR